MQFLRLINSIANSLMYQSKNFSMSYVELLSCYYAVHCICICIIWWRFILTLMSANEFGGAFQFSLHVICIVIKQYDWLPLTTELHKYFRCPKGKFALDGLARSHNIIFSNYLPGEVCPEEVEELCWNPVEIGGIPLPAIPLNRSAAEPPGGVEKLRENCKNKVNFRKNIAFIIGYNRRLFGTSKYESILKNNCISVKFSCEN